MKVACNVILLLISISLVSCSAKKHWFTIHDYNRFENIDLSQGLQNLQFYNDRFIRLIYISDDNLDQYIKSGVFETKGKIIEQSVEIKEETPGRAVNIEDKIIHVEFEIGKSLKFRNFEGTQFYQLAGTRSNGNFYVSYGDKTYLVEIGGTSKLFYSERNKSKTERKNRKASGVKVK